MAAYDRRGAGAWLHHRVSLIVRADGLAQARQVLRCAAYDARVQLRMPQEQPLGRPPAKWMLSGEFDAPLDAAARLTQGLALQLEGEQVVLIRLDVLGGAATQELPPRLPLQRAPLSPPAADPPSSLVTTGVHA